MAFFDVLLAEKNIVADATPLAHKNGVSTLLNNARRKEEAVLGAT